MNEQLKRGDLVNITIRDARVSECENGRFLRFRIGDNRTWLVPLDTGDVDLTFVAHAARRHGLDHTGAIAAGEILAQAATAPAPIVTRRRAPRSPAVAGALTLLLTIALVVAVTLLAVLP